MAVSDHVNLEQFMAGVEKRNPGQIEFVQAVREVAQDIFDFFTLCKSSPNSKVSTKAAGTGCNQITHTC